METLPKLSQYDGIRNLMNDKNGDLAMRERLLRLAAHYESR